MAVPSLATYEAQAQSAYAPQLQADLTTAAATHQANLNTLNTQLSSVGTQYDIQEQNLAQTVKDQTAQINQLYSSRLLGNFSGLQGNDMGAMFSKANQQEQNIETQRTNAINAVNTQITNENLGYNANVGALKSKYQGLEESAAQSSYSAAVKDYEDQQYKQQELALRQQSLQETAAYHAASLSNSAASKYKAKQGSAGQYMFSGPNGQPVSMGEYVQAVGGDVNTILDFLKNGTSYDKSIYNKVNANRGVIQNNSSAILSEIARLDTKNAYGLR